MIKSKIDHPARQAGFSTGAYSDGVAVGKFVFISGQASVDFRSSEFCLGDIEEETKRTLDNISEIVRAAGATMNDVVKCTVHLADINDFDKYNNVYAKYFPNIKPARTTVQSVLAAGLKIEIDCIVVLP